MKRIDEYLNKLYKGDNSKDALELKEEMRQHLFESVAELKNEGLDEETAINTAIDRFDDSTYLRNDLSIFLNSHKKLSKRIRIYSVIGIVLGALVMLFGFVTNNIDAGWGQFDFGKINKFDSNLPLEADEVDFINDIINKKKLNKVQYFSLYKVEDSDGKSDTNEPTLFDTSNDDGLKDKVLTKAFSYGEAMNLYNQGARYEYEDGGIPRWYIEYELSHSVDYYLNICVAISYGLWFASLGGLVLSFTIDNWRNKKISRGA